MTQTSSKPTWSSLIRRQKGSSYSSSKPRPAEGMVLMMSEDDEEQENEQGKKEAPLRAISTYGDPRNPSSPGKEEEGHHRHDTVISPSRATEPRKAKMTMTMGSIKRGVGQMIRAEGLARSGDRMHAEGRISLDAWRKREWHLEQARILKEKAKVIQEQAELHEKAAEEMAP